MLFDTHCHLNFKAFENRVDEVISGAHDNGVEKMIVVGTDEETSKKAVEIAGKYEGIYAAVGIHPHHVFKKEQKKIYVDKEKTGPAAALLPVSAQPANLERDLRAAVDPPARATRILEKLLTSKKVVAIGEVGIDKYEYKNTKYSDYKIDENFIEAQEKLFSEQIKLALQHNKSLIIHNRRAREDILAVLNEVWNKKMEYKTVFHCCEPDKKLFQFAKDHKIFIGIDGDVTYYKEKQTFVKGVPLDLLVLETDAPYLMPRLYQGFGGQAEPLQKPNEPKNVKLISNFIAQLVGETEEKIAEITTNNAKTLFGISRN